MSIAQREPLRLTARIAIALEVLLTIGALGGGAALLLGLRGEILPLPLSALVGSPFAGGALIIWLAVEITIVGHRNKPPLQAS